MKSGATASFSISEEMLTTRGGYWTQMQGLAIEERSSSPVERANSFTSTTKMSESVNDYGLELFAGSLR